MSLWFMNSNLQFFLIYFILKFGLEGLQETFYRAFYIFLSLLQLTYKHTYKNVNNTSYGVKTEAKSL